jgi:hypothetical protein
MRPPKSSICVICGIRPATTDEHVPPRGFFKGITGQFRTVDACSICNNGSSADDEVIRNYISAQIGKQTIGARLLWESGAHKSLLRSPKLRSEFTSTLREVEVSGENGKITKRLAFQIPIHLYQRVFERITRGLYFWHTATILPRESIVKITPFENAPDLNFPEFELFEAHSIADDAFEYRFLISTEDTRNSVWLFSIHKAHWIQCLTAPLG